MVYAKTKVLLSQVTCMAAVPATLEAEAGGSQVPRLSGLLNEFTVSLGNLVRFCLKMKSKRGKGGSILMMEQA